MNTEKGHPDESLVISFPLFKSKSFTVFGPRKWSVNWAKTYKEMNYEKLVTKPFMEEWDFDVFLDIGSGFGYYSVLAAEKGAEVWAFEANPVRWGVVKYNTEMYENIHLPYGAVGKSKKTPNPNQMVLNLPEWEDETDIVDIEPILEKVKDRKVLVKIDVEGFEVDVLEACKKHLKNKNFKWMIEFHTKFCPQKDTMKYLKNMKSKVIAPPPEHNLTNFKTLFYHE